LSGGSRFTGYHQRGNHAHATAAKQLRNIDKQRLRQRTRLSIRRKYLGWRQSIGFGVIGQLNIDDSAISDSVSPSYGVYALGTQASVFVSRSILTNNGMGVCNAGGTVSSSSDNRIFGNTNLGATMTPVARQ
jgi:hypothetical protein